MNLDKLDINISQNTEQYGKATYTFIFEFYGIIMANFLVIFVPKMCGEDICTISDNIHQQNISHSIGFVKYMRQNAYVSTSLYVSDLLPDSAQDRQEIRFIVFY